MPCTVHPGLLSIVTRSRTMSAHLGGAQGFHHWAEHVMRADGPATVALLDPDEFFLEPLTQVRGGWG